MATTIAVMTPADLVRAVEEVTRRSGHPVATGDEIKAWCGASKPMIDWGAYTKPGGNHFWKADHANAPNVLRKFKIEPLTQRGLNGWCIARRWRDGCAWAATQSPRWRAIPWDPKKKNWIWRCAERVDGSVQPFNVFDVQALARCSGSQHDRDDGGEN